MQEEFSTFFTGLHINNTFLTTKKSQIAEW